jgi:predicted transposase YbfD/YdcC
MLDYFIELEDPRDPRGLIYELKTIVFITIAAVLSGCDDYEEITEFGKQRRDWIAQFVTLPEGRNISHDAFTDFYSVLDPDKFASCFINWTSSICKIDKEELVSMDGKCIRGSYDKESGKSAIYMVSAYATNAGVVLAQKKVNSKSNEITAIPELIDLLSLNGASVTIDAMGCQKIIAKKIIESGGQYLLAVKENQSTLLDDIEYSFRDLTIDDRSKTLEKSHGRIEERKCEIIKDIKLIEQAEEWEEINTLVKITTKRTEIIKNHTCTETRYYISSHNRTAEHLNQIARGHWGIENNLHWQLDVTYNEDHSRIRIGNGAENFSTIRKIALNTLKQDKASKKSQKVKRKTAGWNLEYLEKIMNIDCF